MMGTDKGYHKVRALFANKDWEIVGFGNEHLVLRIETENIKFHRSTGAIQDRLEIHSRGKNRG